MHGYYRAMIVYHDPEWMPAMIPTPTGRFRPGLVCIHKFFNGGTCGMTTIKQVSTEKHTGMKRILTIVSNGQKEEEDWE